MELRSLIWKLLKEQVDQNTIVLKNKYVGEGKPISEEDFNKLVEVTGNKFYLLSWLTKKVGTGIIKAEDIYKYKEYFDLYEKNKKKFEHKDIHLYKTAEDVQKFLQEIVTLREGSIVYDETQGQDNFVSQNDIEKLVASGGVKYLGIYDNGNYKYQVFDIFGVNKDVWKLYRDILGRCKGRDKGAKIDICTIGQYSYFKNYLTDPKGSSYFLLFNLDDPRSPYQLHHESGQFMDKNDFEMHKIKKLNFFKFIGDKNPRYDVEGDIISEFEVPVPGKGFEDSKGRKQGLWRYNFPNGQVAQLTTYKNNDERGPFINFYKNGKIEKKGTKEYGDYVGDYEEYYNNGKIYRKGTYGKYGLKADVWLFGDMYGPYTLHDFTNLTQSGFTANQKLRFVSKMRNRNTIHAYGPTTFYGRTGKIVAQGKIGMSGQYLGKWTYFSPDGSIRAVGNYKDASRSGKWKDVVKTKDGNTLILEAEFNEGSPIGGIKISTKDGVFKQTVSPKKIDPPYWHLTYMSRDKFSPF